MRFKKDPEHDADVRRLMDIFPDILPDGRSITHEQIEAAIGTPRIAPRYRTVVNKWRKLLVTERGVYLDGITGSGRGFVALTPDEMVRFGNRGVRAAGRKLKKALAVASLPNDAALSDDMRRYRHLLCAAVERIASEHRTALRDVTRALGPQRQLPRRTA